MEPQLLAVLVRSAALFLLASCTTVESTFVADISEAALRARIGQSASWSSLVGRTNREKALILVLRAQQARVAKQLSVANNLGQQMLQHHPREFLVWSQLVMRALSDGDTATARAVIGRIPDEARTERPRFVRESELLARAFDAFHRDRWDAAERAIDAVSHPTLWPVAGRLQGRIDALRGRPGIEHQGMAFKTRRD